ncbi:MAG: hypothetical protein NTY53_23885, partial [Kiritimatiellaeota bacterium]|nr:hypothetical protein [Kiritimatiellota bacterium]
VPYTIYTIFSGEKKIGYIHGVNQKGQYGGIQVFVALDLKGGIKAYYIQKLTSQWARKLRELEFGRQFVGLSLKDFEAFDVVAGEGPGRLAQVHSPVPEALIDFRAAMRALKKNLILMDVFVFSTQQEKSS